MLVTVSQGKDRAQVRREYNDSRRVQERAIPSLTFPSTHSPLHCRYGLAVRAEQCQFRTLRCVGSHGGELESMSEFSEE